MHAYEGSRSPHASVLHWNPWGFHKNNKGRYFPNRVVYMSMDTSIILMKWGLDFKYNIFVLNQTKVYRQKITK